MMRIFSVGILAHPPVFVTFMRDIAVKPSSLLETFLRNPVPRFPMFFGLCHYTYLAKITCQENPRSLKLAMSY